MPKFWEIQIAMPIRDPHCVVSCTTFIWKGGYGVQRYREVLIDSTEQALIIAMKVRGMRRARVDEAVATFLSALSRRMQDIALQIDDYIAALPYIVRTDFMVLPFQVREEGREVA